MSIRPGPGVHPSHERAADWPFWAPSALESVDDALRLADVGPGSRVIELGCGDGRVLDRIRSLGASAIGIESDPELAAAAREQVGGDGVEIIEGDLFDDEVDLEADIWFAYLAPATLQRLLPRLERTGGGTLVTVDFEVPGISVSSRAGAAARYDLPAQRPAVACLGWPGAGTLVATVPDVQSLTCLEVVHPAGPCAVTVSGPIADAVTAFAGADDLADDGPLAVDLRWEGSRSTTFLAGTVGSAATDSHAVFVVFGDEEGVWDLEQEAVERLTAAASRSSGWTLAEVLAAADGD